MAPKVCGLPACTVAVAGETCRLMGEAVVTCALCEPEAIAPGSGFLTVMEALPTWLVVAVPVAVNCVEETRVVLSATPLKSMAAPTAK